MTRSGLRGFSLIELAVSIVIIGLLVGGISGGSKLLAQAELRAMISQMDQIKADYNSFKLEYNAVPGDMVDASVFFSNCATGGVGNANCNGNGDGYVTANQGNVFDGATNGDEPVKFFRHLNLSGINTQGGATSLPSNYSFGNYSNTQYFPKGKITGSSINVATVDNGNLSTSWSSPVICGFSNGVGQYLDSNFPVNTTVVFAVKADFPTTVAGAMPALLAHNIDRKVDDGDSSGGVAIGANTGKVRTLNDLTAANACVSTNTYNIATVQSTCVVQMLIK